jgi:hypothetical protein
MTIRERQQFETARNMPAEVLLAAVDDQAKKGRFSEAQCNQLASAYRDSAEVARKLRVAKNGGKFMKRFFTAILIVYSLFLTACPKETAVRKAAKASYELSGITLDVIHTTEKAYAAGILSLAAKDRLAGYEKRVASGGKHFNDVLVAFNAQTSGNLTADQLGVLNKILSDEIVTPFLAILQELAVVSLDQVAYLKTAIAALRTAILIISETVAQAGYPDAQRRVNYSYAG